MLILPHNECINILKKDNGSSDDTFNLKGYVFTVNLFDIIQIYNKVGDELFKKNVRLGIGEQMGVDTAIKNTLKEDPQYFWFRNNGITILKEKPELTFDRSNEIVLKKNNTKELGFSVINGAQTITSAAEFFYSGTDTEKAKQAKVLLRIIEITNGKEENEEKPTEGKNISVSLNRQKPIKLEDIALTSPFVEELNNYLHENKYGYTIIRRGENYISNNTYSLIEFARAATACSGQPGEARSKAASTLLKMKEDQSFESKIFKDKFLNFDEQSEVFKKYYNPILFAMKLANAYEKVYKKIEIKEETDEASYISSIIHNGKWYFVAYIVFVLNENQDDNYTNYKIMDIKKNSNDLLESLIIEFARLFMKVNKRDYPNIDSNTFKKSDAYRKLKEFQDKSSKIRDIITCLVKESEDNVNKCEEK